MIRTGFTVITSLLLVAPAWTPQSSGVTARLRGVSAVSDRVAGQRQWRHRSNRTSDGGVTRSASPFPTPRNSTSATSMR